MLTLKINDTTDIAADIKSSDGLKHNIITSSTAIKNSPTGNRTPVSRVRVLYPNQLDYRGVELQQCGMMGYMFLDGLWQLLIHLNQFQTRLIFPQTLCWNLIYFLWLANSTRIKNYNFVENALAASFVYCQYTWHTSLFEVDKTRYILHNEFRLGFPIIGKLSTAQ